MRHAVLGALFACLLAVPAVAQNAQNGSPANPMSTWLRNIYKSNGNNIARAAEKMPEGNYGMRPARRWKFAPTAS